MKRTLTAIIIFAVVVGSGIGIYFRTVIFTSQLICKLEENQKFTTQYNKISKEQTENAIEFWNDSKCFMASFHSHNELDAVEIGIKNLECYSEQNNVDEYIEVLNECIGTLYHIRDSEKPKIENIF